MGNAEERMQYDDILKTSMLKETSLFFDEVLKNDLSLTHFVSSDFFILNARLAKRYGIPGVDGMEMRRVTLPSDSHRGGLLTMGSVLKVTANGTTTSPITRGSWVLERILGTPPPKPPLDVEAIEPDIRGATTIREQLAKHRDIDQYKKLLLDDKDQLARNLTEKLLAYGTGATPTHADQPQIEIIVNRLRDKDYGFKALIHEVVQSDLFQSK